jgi:hypothetical protein
MGERSKDMCGREVNPGDFVLLSSISLKYKFLHISNIGIAYAKNKYLVLNFKDEIEEVSSDEVYLLAEQCEVLDDYKQKLLTAYNKFAIDKMQKSIKMQEFKVKNKVQNRGEIYKDRFNRCYIYLGFNNVTITNKSNDENVINKVGYLYVKVPRSRISKKLETICDLDEIVSVIPIEYQSYLNEVFLIFKSKSNRFVDFAFDDPIKLSWEEDGEQCADIILKSEPIYKNYEVKIRGIKKGK